MTNFITLITGIFTYWKWVLVLVGTVLVCGIVLDLILRLVLKCKNQKGIKTLFRQVLVFIGLFGFSFLVIWLNNKYGKVLVGFTWKYAVIDAGLLMLVSLATREALLGISRIIVLPIKAILWNKFKKTSAKEVVELEKEVEVLIKKWVAAKRKTMSTKELFKDKTAFLAYVASNLTKTYSNTSTVATEIFNKYKDKLIK